MATVECVAYGEIADMVACNAATRYEVILTNGRESHFLEFSARIGRSALLRSIAAHGPRILAITDASASPILDSDHAKWNAKREAWTLGAWAIQRSGRTERDIKNAIGA